MTTMLFERIGDVIVLVHNSKHPSEDEWSRYVNAVDICQRSPQQLRGVLVTSLGGAPNTGQRKAIVTAAGPQLFVTCVCTDSMVARGVITAINWLYAARVHALPFHAIDPALEILKVPLDERPALKALAQRLQAELLSS